MVPQVCISRQDYGTCYLQPAKHNTVDGTFLSDYEGRKLKESCQNTKKSHVRLSYCPPQ